MSSLLVEEVSGWPEPAEIFARLASAPGSFFLDSALSMEGKPAYSFIGCEPFLQIEGQREQVVMNWDNGVIGRERGDPQELLRSLLKRFASRPHPSIPFVGGAVGYFSYEYGARWEGIDGRDLAGRPLFELSFYDGLLAYAHGSHRWFVVANPIHRTGAAQIRDRLLARVHAGHFQSPLAMPPVSGLVPAEITSKDKYIDGVRRIQNYIASGDIYQVNLAQRFEGKWPGEAYDLYRRLRSATPAPFGTFFHTSFGHVLSCSPERFLRVRDRKVETRPIKGTRPRGLSAAEDKQRAAELLASPKERAELLMIVDLERNDLGRVCVPGSIKVEELYRVEPHPTVFHLVATVSGKLRAECDVLDVLRAAFPGGSITGAPKIRAMQIIAEIEPEPRHVYTGALGYLGFDGNCDLNIAIRTVVLQEERATYHVGAGIVADSNPESEYEETLAKGRALQSAFVMSPPASPTSA